MVVWAHFLDSATAVESFGSHLDRSVDLTTGHVLIHLDIDPTVSWDFRTQPGALRRVMMNFKLLGNSLKRITEGPIWVTMRQVTPPDAERQQWWKKSNITNTFGSCETVNKRKTFHWSVQFAF